MKNYSYTLKEWMNCYDENLRPYEGLQVVEMYGCLGTDRPHPFKHKNIHNWCVLENGMAVGFNENPSYGWSFPFKKNYRKVGTRMENRIKSEIAISMKAKNKERTNTLRGILADAAQLAHLEKRKELKDEDVLSAITKGIKQREESVKTYSDAGREDLANAERTEIEIYTEFLPKQLTDEEVGAIIEEVIDEVGATSMKQMGAVMGKVMSLVKGKYDGSKVSGLVKSKLG